MVAMKPESDKIKFFYQVIATLSEIRQIPSGIGDFFLDNSIYLNCYLNLDRFIQRTEKGSILLIIRLGYAFI